VTLEGEHCIVARHSTAIVCDAQEPAPARFNINLYATRSGINRILDQLFGDGRGPLDDFTRSDLIYQLI
jgi:hypothetical protein